MKKYRIAVIATTTYFGEPVSCYAVQVRVALFWWVTIETMGQPCQARYYLKHSTGKPEKVLKVIK